MSEIFIEPIPVQKEVSYIKITVNGFELMATECTLSIWEHDSTGKILDFKMLHVPPEIYGQWKEDDQYIIDYALNQLGYVEKKDVSILL